MPVVIHEYRTAAGKPVRGPKVYFIKAGRFVKIGTTDGSLERRLFAIQSHNPIQVHILCALEGGREAEIRWHAHFHPHWVRGEWFNLTDKVYAEIAALARSGSAIVIDQHRISGTLTRQDPKWRNARMERISRLMGRSAEKSPVAEV